jgi:hypothetical protein
MFDELVNPGDLLFACRTPWNDNTLPAQTRQTFTPLGNTKPVTTGRSLQ